MSVRKRVWKAASGEIRTAWLVDYADRSGERRRKHFASKKAADAFRIETESRLRAGTYRAAADKVILKDACASFLGICEGRCQRDERMTRKMLAVYRGHVSNHILHPDHGVGGHRLAQFTARSVSDFRDRIRTAGVTVPTARKVLATLHSVLAHAVAQDWIATNAAHGIRVIGPRGEGSRKISPPSKDDMRAVIEARTRIFGSSYWLLHRQVRGLESNGPFVGVTWIWTSTSCTSAAASMPTATRARRRAGRACEQSRYLANSSQH